MSTSPFKFGRQSSSSANSRNAASAQEPLTLSQALLITAGLAGLVGLFCGVIIRFSLSNSPKARFLSPLQTFPSLSDWAPELPQGTADSHYLPGGAEAQKEPINRELGRGLSDPQRQFDSFVDPKINADGYRREDNFGIEGERFPNDDSFGEPSLREPYSEDSYVEEVYTEEPYAEEPYAEEPYAEESYAEESYPEIEAPPEEGPYYERWFWRH